MRRLTAIFLFASILCLGACTKYVPYSKADIQQGNILSQAQVSQLKLGMSQQAVIKVLGTPSISPAFNTQQLTYVNINIPGKGAKTEKRLILSFKHDRLSRANGDFKTSF
jgi:outer membrane protein assembly factor BamE